MVWTGKSFPRFTERHRLERRRPNICGRSSRTVCSSASCPRTLASSQQVERWQTAADCSYICDIAVLPSYQGTGLGKQIVSHLVERSSGHKKIILYAVPGKEPFYKNFGFLRMSTAMAIFENQLQQLERGYLSEA
jgi:citrate lyase synthetase